jgi:hypothetical protein
MYCIHIFILRVPTTVPDFAVNNCVILSGTIMSLCVKPHSADRSSSVTIIY